jgi:tetratricopeptide (TPR) repeat protein
MTTDTAVAARRVYSSEFYRVDFFPSPTSTGRLLFTFTEGYERDLAGLGFAGKFALESGFDLIAIKSRVDRFYHDLPRTAFYCIDDFIAGLDRQPTWRGGYGGSMGGFAAIYFANELELDTVLAFSPQFDIAQDWDRRWALQNAGIPHFRPLTRRRVNPACKYVIVYDPYDDDRMHVQRYAKILPAANLVLIRTPFFGHPAHTFLIEMRCIKPLSMAVFSGADAVAERRKAQAARSRMPWYFFRLAGHCARTRKFRWAEAAIARALALDPACAEFHISAADIAERQRKFAAGITHARAAVALAPQHPHMRAILARLLLAQGESTQARHHIDHALAAHPNDPDFWYIRAQIPSLA